MLRMTIATCFVFAACASLPDVTDETRPRQGVSGVVTYIPGIDGEDATLYFDPPDRTPRPLRGAAVSLYEFKGDDKPAGKIAAAAVTDSLGDYELRAEPGRYFLTVSNAPRAMIITTGRQGVNFSRSDAVCAFRIVTLDPNSIIVEDFELEEMSVQ